jgi:hypothetical protein
MKAKNRRYIEKKVDMIMKNEAPIPLLSRR